MSEHLLEILLEYRSHPNAFVRQSTLCGITIILSTLPSMNCPVSINEWLQGMYQQLVYLCLYHSLQVLLLMIVIVTADH